MGTVTTKRTTDGFKPYHVFVDGKLFGYLRISPGHGAFDLKAGLYDTADTLIILAVTKKDALTILGGGTPKHPSSRRLA